MNLIKKTIVYFKSDGLINTVNKINLKIIKEIRKVPYKLIEIINGKHMLKNLKTEINGKNVYIIIPCIDWNIPLFQRPHQVAYNLSKKENSIVLFFPDQYQYDNFASCKKIDINLWLYSIRMKREVNKLLENAKSKTVFMSWTRHADLLNYINYDKLVYEYIDEMSLFYYYNDEMEKTHQILMQKADLTVCTASELYKKAAPYAKRVLLSENAGDYNFFYENRDCSIEPKLKEKIKGYSCVIGYYGCLAYWFDYKTICEVANRRNDWLFVLVGYEFDNSFQQLNGIKHNNIIYISAQPYEKLPYYVSAFDIQTIPFVINEVTKSTSPVKLFEYMASGKPILTSNLPECLKYKSVYTYSNTDEFIKKVEILLNLDKNHTYYKTMEIEALENTWEARVNNILENLSTI
jgi:glycosyltransferase involved in cell wall biosynthesis